MSKVWKFILVLLLAAGATIAQAAPASEARGALLAVSDGKGGLTLVWVPPPGRWPAAWQVAEEGGRVLLPKVGRGDAYAAAAAARLAPELRNAVQEFDAAYAEAQKAEAALQSYVVTAMRVLTDNSVARAMASSVALADVASGARRYVVTELDAAGRPGAIRLVSPLVDAAVPTPPPAAPTAVNARNVQEGVALSWQQDAGSRDFPVFGHVVEVVQGGQARTLGALVPANAARAADAPVLVDRDARREADAIYRVYAVGPAGLRSAPTSVALFVEDLAALVPPRDVRTTVAPGVVTVSWSAFSNPHTRGAVVERAQVLGGLWETLTPKPVAGTSWRDESPRAGSTYYYRVRFTGPRGDAGAPSVPASARAVGRGAPEAVSGLVAEPGRTRVTLRWNPAPGAVAGYRVERDIGTGNWVSMTGSLLREPRFDDDFPGGSDGLVLRYRVAAVAFDEQQGGFAEVRATLPDIVPPPPPRILTVEALPGRATVTLATPGLAAGDRLLLLRARAADQPGLVIGDPRALAASLVDDGAEPGALLWYRVVALDAAGNRSEPSPAVVVRIPVGEVPVAHKPRVIFEASPLPHVKVAYAAAPAHLKTVLQWRAGEAPWQFLAGPLAGAGESVQVNVPRGEPLAYRAVWVDAAGNEGEPSPSVALPVLAP